jgi:hypothetical protein
MAPACRIRSACPLRDRPERSAVSRGWPTTTRHWPVVRDLDGREIVLLTRIWEQKITRDHPELVGHLDAVVATVAHPDHTEPDSRPERTRLYRRDVGPSRWLLVVVSYEQQPGRVITALANRKDPKLWTP